MKKYKFLHYEPKTHLEDIEKYLTDLYQDWEVVGVSANEYGLMILLCKIV
jgi:uncharacterized membrane protein YgcG